MTLGEYARIEVEARRQRLEVAIRAALASPDAEAVHRLRTSWRRLEAAVSLLPWYPLPAAWKKLRKRMKVVMSHSGELRDRDNALARLAANENLCLCLRGQRGLWETPFLHHLARLLPLDLPPAESFSDGAAVDVVFASQHFLLRGERALGKRLSKLDASSDICAWHKFRIAAKRHRYTLEFFGSLAVNSFTEELSRYKEIQDKLGAIQDLAAAAKVARAAASEKSLIRASLRELKSELHGLLSALALEKP
jgi:CHAD domain-containing protein